MKISWKHKTTWNIPHSIRVSGFPATFHVILRKIDFLWDSAVRNTASLTSPILYFGGQYYFILRYEDSTWNFRPFVSASVYAEWRPLGYPYWQRPPLFYTNLSWRCHDTYPPLPVFKKAYSWLIGNDENVSKYWQKKFQIQGPSPVCADWRGPDGRRTGLLKNLIYWRNRWLVITPRGQSKALVRALKTRAGKIHNYRGLSSREVCIALKAIAAKIRKVET